MTYLNIVQEYAKKGILPPNLVSTLVDWHSNYTKAASENNYSKDQIEAILKKFLDLVVDQLKHPFAFDYFHKHLTTPVDYYVEGLEFIRPLVMMDQSTLIGEQYVSEIDAAISRGENVILLANHQTEADPQAISLLLEKKHPNLAREMIFVAGHRVTTDPLAVPFSKGRNLLCIYSKRYVEKDSEHREEKLRHNQRTMKRMGELLAAGGQCIYVAPSGGRDRPGRDGEPEVAPFDPQSIELFLLLAKSAKKRTHFYPLALWTYHLLPPPDTIEKALGEIRRTKATPIHIAFGPEINFDIDIEDKKLRREQRAQIAWKQVCQLYARLNK